MKKHSMKFVFENRSFINGIKDGVYKILIAMIIFVFTEKVFVQAIASRLVPIHKEVSIVIRCESGHHQSTNQNANTDDPWAQILAFVDQVWEFLDEVFDRDVFGFRWHIFKSHFEFRVTLLVD